MKHPIYRIGGSRDDLRSKGSPPKLPPPRLNPPVMFCGFVWDISFRIEDATGALRSHSVMEWVWDSGPSWPWFPLDGAMHDELLNSQTSFIVLCAVSFPYTDQSGPLWDDSCPWVWRCFVIWKNTTFVLVLHKDFPGCTRWDLCLVKLPVDKWRPSSEQEIIEFLWKLIEICVF